MSLLSPFGLILNNSLINVISNTSENVENVKIRVNSIPTHQLLKGEVDSLQISLKQWQPQPNIRIELLELETDSVKLNLPEIRHIKLDNWQKSLKSPLNMGYRLILTENDLNNLIKSPQAESIIAKVGGNSQESQFQIISLTFNLLPNNRIAIDTKLKFPTRTEELLNVNLEFSLQLIKGHTLKINDIQGTLNNRRLSSKLLQGFADNINTQLNLRNLEKSGITMRLLQLNINENNLEITGFLHLQPQLSHSNL
ncbi:DUF2993 domain-containing protein [Geminocystis sp. GBBB08]|uniref:LmeA family phospholipid-binding protein n=1 Tax=Geminocystis sp. GBBB08 TaxID=2604140 RepID=UPI0027E3317D|nr:DUF2993 domain-containing protein [Geminocystis sp. GBBB08]